MRSLSRRVRIITCSQHGKVFGPFCKECAAQRYADKVKAGLIKPKPLVELNGHGEKDPTPTQIRFRALQAREQRMMTQQRLSRWVQKPRVVRIFSIHVFEEYYR